MGDAAENAQQPGFHIPPNRPVTNGDVQDFVQYYELTQTEAKYFLGLTSHSLSEIMNADHRDRPVKSKSLALLMRVYSEYPERVPKKVPTAGIHDVAEVVDTGKMSIWGPLLGHGVTSGYRWIRKQQKLGGSTAILAHHMIELVKGNGVRYWRQQFVDVEARARGIEDVFSGQGWHEPVPVPAPVPDPVPEDAETANPGPATRPPQARQDD